MSKGWRRKEILLILERLSSSLCISSFVLWGLLPPLPTHCVHVLGGAIWHMQTAEQAFILVFNTICKDKMITLWWLLWRWRCPKLSQSEGLVRTSSSLLGFNTCLLLALQQAPKWDPSSWLPVEQRHPRQSWFAVQSCDPVQPEGPWLTQAPCVRGAWGALSGSPLPSACHWLKGWAIFPLSLGQWLLFMLL